MLLYILIMNSVDNRIRMSRPHYTEAEIRDHSEQLPGFSEPGTIWRAYNEFKGETIGEGSLWQPVLSATIVSEFDGAMHVLTGNRTSEGNRTHINVASTPTMRLSSAVAALIMGEETPFCLDGNINPAHPFVSESQWPGVEGLPDSQGTLASQVGNLLAMKLDLGRAMETSPDLLGRTSLARHTVGFSYLEDSDIGEPLYEPLILFGAVVGLTREAAELIPKETQSYSHLGWAPIEQYVKGVEDKSVLDVIPSARPTDELEVCVRGLCNATSSAIVSDPVEIKRHLTENYILPSMWS